jgi:hypothetical protein
VILKTLIIFRNKPFFKFIFFGQSGVISLGFIVMVVILVTTIVIAVLVIKQRHHCFHSKLYSLDLLGKKQRCNMILEGEATGHRH